MAPAPDSGGGSEGTPKPQPAKEAEAKGGRALEWIKAIGMPLATILVTGVGGWYFTILTKDREARESNERLYAQLLTQREESDAMIRKDMFRVVITDFLEGSKQADWSNKVLQLELLASNFNQSLDLAPLFKDMARRLTRNAALPERLELRKRLDATAADLIFRQVTSLARRGYAEFTQVRLGGWEEKVGTPYIDARIPKSRLVPPGASAPVADAAEIRFSVEIIGVNFEEREVEVRLQVDFPGGVDRDVDRHFWVGRYDFPMLDNTQLSDGLRASVVLTEFFVPENKSERVANSFLKLHLVVFPAASASFKERQDYDDILLDMLRAKGRSSSEGGGQP